MGLTVLSVAYPFAAVSSDASGGSEQVLTHLDRALVEAGHRSLVIAPEGSMVMGELIALEAVPGPLDDQAMRQGRALCRQALTRAIDQRAIDLVHFHGLDFYFYLPAPGLPILTTLHLPIDWYPQSALRPSRPSSWFNCVSATQHSAVANNPHMLAPIGNGVDVERLNVVRRPRGFALVLTRICPEKGIHLAIAAAKQARMPIVIAGEIFPYAAHHDYFDQEIAPGLGADCRFIGPADFAQKRQLLAEAQCLLVPSLVEETSSLVAREAAAAGTPVIAFARGALPEAVVHGVTGYLVETVEEMAAAIPLARRIDPEACRLIARQRFSHKAMVRAYFGHWQMLAGGSLGRRRGVA
jgi:glycosyltransferase involved in cell wall biosynthesis